MGVTHLTPWVFLCLVQNLVPIRRFSKICREIAVSRRRAEACMVANSVSRNDRNWCYTVCATAS